MEKRKIIQINGEKCDGCGLCIPNCPEGALRIIDGKARLISDLFCDGLGACIGHCPRGAITIEERDAEPYDERRVMENIIKQGKNVIKAHLSHLKDHNQTEYFKQAFELLKEKGVKDPLGEETKKEVSPHSSGCPGSRMMDFRAKRPAGDDKSAGKTESQLRQWPVQTHLVPAFAPYLQDADLLISADCVPFAYADFHRDLLKGRILLIGCPKLDDLVSYEKKLREIFQNNRIRAVTYAHMEVPCCFGLIDIIKAAISASGKDTPFEEVTIGINGGRIA
jgi:NAD-dependent dihydropyrimidine dehydrogenase PreA subunit